MKIRFYLPRECDDNIQNQKLMQMLVRTDITELNLESNGTNRDQKGVPGMVQPVVTSANSGSGGGTPPAESAPAPKLGTGAEAAPNQYVCAQYFYRAPGPKRPCRGGEMVNPKTSVLLA